MRPQPKPVKKKKKNKPLTYKQEYDKLYKELGKDGGLWSKVIHSIYNHKCACCDRAGHSAHHFFGKAAHPSVRFHTDNGILLCKNDHFRVHRRGETEMVRDALIKRIGQERFDRVKRMANKAVKYTYDDLIAIKKQLLAELNGVFID